MMKAKDILEKMNKVLKESLDDYGLRLNDSVNMEDTSHYGEIGTIVDYDDAKRTVTVEFGSHGERAELSIEDSGQEVLLFT